MCDKCTESVGQRNWLLRGDDEGGLVLHFRKIVDTILSIISDSLDPYIQALRLTLCAQCKHLSPEGPCTVWGRADCGLDRYVPLLLR